jgi:serine/threonine protein kinase
VFLQQALSHRAGKVSNISYSLAYTPPEVVLCLEASQKSMLASEAVDMWALGVIAYELLCSSQTFPYGTKREVIFDQISGRSLLPWEDPRTADHRAVMLRGLRRSVMMCLNRDPEMRPSAERLLMSWNHMFDAYSSVGGTSTEYTVDDKSDLVDGFTTQIFPPCALPPSCYS